MHGRFTSLLQKIPASAVLAAGFSIFALLTARLGVMRAHSPFTLDNWQWPGGGAMHWFFTHDKVCLLWLAAVGGLAAVGALLPLGRGAWEGITGALERLAGREKGPVLGLHPLVFSAMLFALAIRLPTLFLAQFYYDDYAFIRVERTKPLIEALSTLHSDHVLIIYRLMVTLLDAVFGLHAPGWNLVCLAIYAAALWILARIMALCRVHPAAATLALFIVAIGRTAAQLLTGYYCVSLITLPTATAGLGSFLWLEKACRTGDAKSTYAGLALLLFGGLNDFSGVWVFVAVPLLLLAVSDAPLSAKGILDWVKRQRRVASGYVVVLALAAVVYGAMYAIKFNEKNVPWLIEMHEKNPRTVGGTIGILFHYFADGMVLQLSLPMFTLPLLATCAAFLLGAGALGGVFVLANERERRVLAALMMAIAFFALEVAVGRPHRGEGLFAPQYVAPVHLMMTVVLGVGFTAVGRALRRGGLRPLGWAVWMSAFATLAASAGMPSGFLYLRALAQEQQVHQDLIDLGRRLSELVEQGGSKVKSLPVLELASLRMFYPEPRPNLDLCELIFWCPREVQAVPLVRNDATSALLLGGDSIPGNVKLVPSLREACGPQFAETLARTHGALALYGAPMEMEPVAPSAADQVSAPAAQSLVNATAATEAPGGGVKFTSLGAAEYVVASQSFDPEKRRRLVIRANGDANGKAPAVEVLAESVVFGAIHASIPLTTGGVQLPNKPTGFRYYRDLPAGAPETLAFDLCRLPLFALSPEIESVRLRFATPGIYEIDAIGF